MSKLLITASALALLTGTAALANPVAEAGVGASSVGILGEASVEIDGEQAYARVDNIFGGLFDRSAVAEVGDGVVASTEGNEFGPSNYGTATVGFDAPANANAQFQQGNDNDAINWQTGSYQQTATLQIGDENQALTWQTGVGNEAAVAQVGNENVGASVQDGDDNGAAMAQLGDMNMSFGWQVGGALNVPDYGNFLAHGQYGDNNTAVTFQNGEGNTAAALQVGNSNTSFISQGQGISVSVEPLPGKIFSASLPMGVTMGGTGLGDPSNNNSAASLQRGNSHVSAILQTGNGNTAVNYQSSF